MDQDRQTFEALTRRIDSRSKLLRTWELKGGVSAQMTGFEIELDDGRTERLIVRRHGARDLNRNPDVAAHEFRLLQLVASAGLPAPTPRYLDPSGELFSTPFLVVDYVEGEPAPADVDGPELVTELARVLAEIHRVGSTGDMSFLRERELADATRSESAEERRIRDVLDSAQPLPRRNRSVLLHGDFWPGNTLWNDGRLVAVIDWEDAAVGDPLADVANARLEVLWARGLDAMEEFTHRYAANATDVDLTDLPYWDLWADLRLVGRTGEWGLDDVTEKAMRTEHEGFVLQALEKLQD
jgi:aminoglycoside phosphotransferase (APT) family kinase protein